MARYEHQDHYHRKAKAEGKISRASYKIEEIQAKLRLIKPGFRVLDLGCAPGGWLKPLAQWVGAKGRVVGIDLDPITIDMPTQVETFVGDINDYIDRPERLTDALGGLAHAVVSDMAPHTSGTKFQDQARSAELVELAWLCAQACLTPGGHFIAKIFDGPDVQRIRQELQQQFQSVKTITPQASRKGSFERYLVATHKM